jgi:hypothetical protein
LGISQTIHSIKNKIIQVSNNTFITSVELPENYWSLTLSQKEIRNVEESDLDNEMQNFNQNNLYFFSLDNPVSRKSEAKDNFLRPRSDWDIKQGDYIVKPKKIKRKLIKKPELKSFISGFWYIIFSLFVTYIIMNFLTKID